MKVVHPFGPISLAKFLRDRSTFGAPSVYIASIIFKSNKKIKASSFPTPTGIQQNNSSTV